MPASFARIPSYRTARAMGDALAELGMPIPVSESLDPEPLGQPMTIGGRRVGNRFCVQPMEGWDGTADGRPTEHTLARWRRFGAGGAKLIWGCEAVAVRRDGRANPEQLCLGPSTATAIGDLLVALRAAHGTADDLLVGLQLTHSGRYSRPDRKDRLEPRVAYRHPILDRRVGLPADAPIFTDTELDELLGDYARAAFLAQELGFDFVDVKHCHGYLLHELLSARTRPGPYGGDFEGRTRFLRLVVDAVRREAPKLLLGIRLSAFDLIPYRAGPDGKGEPEAWEGAYECGFGVNPDAPTEPDLDEPRQLARLIASLGVPLCNLTAGSPYYNPHIQRPAQYPPSDGYLPPEDPLLGVARQIRTVQALKAEMPGVAVIGSGYSYLQEYLPHVAAAVVSEGWADAVGLGRMSLSYPEMPRDTLEGRLPDRRRICRTFSDCTTAPRNGMRSGCYPLDPAYRATPEWTRLQAIKRAQASG